MVWVILRDGIGGIMDGMGGIIDGMGSIKRWYGGY